MEAITANKRSAHVTFSNGCIIASRPTGISSYKISVSSQPSKIQDMIADIRTSIRHARTQEFQKRPLKSMTLASLIRVAHGKKAEVDEESENLRRDLLQQRFYEYMGYKCRSYTSQELSRAFATPVHKFQ
eukprot:m.141426 g.141426  ORF g.141426 m.141426 type:complete len:130 (-) comp39119_c0_seq1:45-434(-)